MRDFRGLKVWEKAHKLTPAVYAATRAFPKEEVDGLTSQIRRAASSVPANLAEGCGRKTDAEFVRYCQIVFGSANEFDYHLLLAKDLGYIDEFTHAGLQEGVVEVKRMLSGLVASVRSNGEAVRSRGLTAEA